MTSLAHQQDIIASVQDLVEEQKKWGIEKGIEKGIVKGSHDKAITIALKMIKAGKSDQEIADLTELSLDEVKQLRSEAE